MRGSCAFPSRLSRGPSELLPRSSHRSGDARALARSSSELTGHRGARSAPQHPVFRHQASASRSISAFSSLIKPSFGMGRCALPAYLGDESPANERPALPHSDQCRHRSAFLLRTHEVCRLKYRWWQLSGRHDGTCGPCRTCRLTNGRWK